MEKIKNESGITIVSLVIAIALLLIILSISITVGTREVDNSIDSVQITELQTVQTAVLNRATLHKTANVGLIGDKMNKTDAQNFASSIGVAALVQIPENYPDSDYYILNPEQLKQIGIDNSKDSYIVNYTSGEVMNYTTISSNENAPLYIIGTKKFDNDL